MLCVSINWRSEAFPELCLYSHSCSGFQLCWRRIGEAWVSISSFLYSEYAIALLYDCTILLLQRFCVRGRLLLLFASFFPPSLSGDFYPLVCSSQCAAGPVSLLEEVLVFGANDRVACSKGLCSGISVSLRIQPTRSSPIEKFCRDDR